MVGFRGFIFVVGAVLQMIANYETLLAGRFIGGLGVGATSMLSPQFLAGKTFLFLSVFALIKKKKKEKNTRTKPAIEQRAHPNPCEAQ